MEITGFVAIGNGEKCPYCDLIQGKDFDSPLEHFQADHKEEFKNLTPDNFDMVFNKYQVKINYYQSHLSW